MDENKTQEESYAVNQKRTIAAMVIGAPDLNGNIITKIYARGDEHLIYEIKGTNPVDSLKVVIFTIIEDNIKPINDFQSVKDSFDKLKSVLYKTGSDSSFRQRAASAIVTAIHGNVEEAKTLLVNIEKDVNEDYKHKIYGRLFYLFGSIIVTLILSFASLWVYLNRSTEFLMANKELSIICYAVTYAALGGFFSVSLKAKEVFNQRAISYWMYTVYGAERLSVSIISGIATYTLISSGLVLSTFHTANGEIYTLLSVCFLSGFSETLIPNSLNKLESKSNNS
mgnify:CR=1 FL=1